MDKPSVTTKPESKLTETNFGIENIFEGKPKKGTVIGVISEDDYNAHQQFDRVLMLANIKPNAVEADEIVHALDSKRNWWMNICSSRNIPYAWPIAFDEYTRVIFVTE